MGILIMIFVAWFICKQIKQNQKNKKTAKHKFS